MPNILHGRAIKREAPEPARTRQDIDARTWLAANGYADCAAIIDKIEKIWKVRGVKTRRNWWGAFAGTKAGEPIVIEGITLPMLASFRERQGFEIAEGEIRRSLSESLPTRIRAQKRWQRKKKNKKK